MWSVFLNVTAIAVSIFHAPLVVVLVGQQHHVGITLENDPLRHLLPLAALLAPSARRQRERRAGQAVQRHPVVPIHLVVLRDDGRAVEIQRQCRVPFKAALREEIGGTRTIATAGKVERVEERAKPLTPDLGEPRGGVAVEAVPFVGLEGPFRLDGRELSEVAD